MDKEYWNMIAEEFKEFNIPTKNTNKLIELVEKNLKVEKGIMLDLGCGAGQYSIALANKFDKIIAIDYSENMLEAAKINAEKNNVKNIEFYKMDWMHEEMDFLNGKKFDVSIGRMTPAIADEASLIKFISVSRGQCYISKFIRRTSTLEEKISNILKQDKEYRGDKTFLLEVMEALWKLDILPELYYEKMEYSEKEKIEKAIEKLELKWGNVLDDIKIEKAIEKLELKWGNVLDDIKILDALKEIEEDGAVENIVKSTIATLYWEVN